MLITQYTAHRISGVESFDLHSPHIRILLGPRTLFGSYFMKMFVVLCLFGDLVDVELPFRSWSNYGHISFNHIPELGKLIQSAFTHKASNVCNSFIVRAGQLWPGLFRIHVHRAELVDHRGFPCHPIRSCLKNMGPFEVVLMATIKNKYTGAKITNASKRVNNV